MGIITALVGSTVIPPVQGTPSDLPLVNTAEEEETKSGVDGALIGAIVGAIVGLGLLTLILVGLAKYFGVCCTGAVARAGAAGAGAADDIYETPIVVPVAGKKGFYDGLKGPGFSDLAFDNNAYATSVENIAGVSPEPPAYSEADPIESPYSDVCPPMYDNIAAGVAPTPSAPVYDNLAKSANNNSNKQGNYADKKEQLYDNKTHDVDTKANDVGKNKESYDNKTYEPAPEVSNDDIISAKDGLKPIGARLV